MNFELDNDSFAQELTSELGFEARKKVKGRRRSTIRRVSSKKPKGQKVYGKSGKARLGRWVRV